MDFAMLDIESIYCILDWTDDFEDGGESEVPRKTNN